MTLSRRHGLTFHLYFDPEGTLWFEVHRDRDGAVLDFQPIADTEMTLETATDHWIAHHLEEHFSDIEVEPCRSCKSPCQRPRYTENGIDERDELAWRFDLCPTCADRLRTQHPWLDNYLNPAEDETEDW